MGLVFQEFKFLPDMTALDNVALAALVVGAPRKESYAKGYRLLCQLGLEEKCHVKPVALSAGEQQRIAIARALMNDPMVLLADEPTGNLDPESVEETMDLLLRIQERGTTILIATHKHDLVKRYGRRIVSLRQGGLVDDLERARGEPGS
jgi:cell division transport system ATP-binding protein